MPNEDQQTFGFFWECIPVLHLPRHGPTGTNLDSGAGTVFSVLDFVTGEFASRKYTSTVWALIETLCRKYVHESSRTINKAKRTIPFLWLSAKLNTKLQRIILLRDLQIAVKKDPF